MSDPSLPFITVVMPVRNEECFIGDTVFQVISQQYPKSRFEVIVVDGLSDDRTPEIIREMIPVHPNILLFTNQERRSSAGRNIGFRNGKGDLFLVIDGHCHVPNKNLLWSVAEVFRKSGADCLGRPQSLDPPGLTTFQKAVSVARASWLGHSGHSLIYSDYEGFCSPVSNGSAYRREVFDKVGYVDETFDAAEDVEFNYRVEKAGLRCYTSPTLEVKYYPREKILGLAQQMIRYGTGRFRFIRKHPGTFNLDMAVAPLFALGLIGTVAATVSWLSMGRGGSIAAIGGTVIGLYALAVCTESLRIAFRQGVRLFTYLPPIFMTVHVGLGYGFLSAVFRDVLWRRSESGS